jgi:Rhodopirellula transposase DDE domain
MNGRGHGLDSYDVIVNLIAGTTTRTGLTVQSERDSTTYETGINVTQAEMKQIPLVHTSFMENGIIPSRSQWETLRKKVSNLITDP